MTSTSRTSATSSPRPSATWSRSRRRTSTTSSAASGALPTCRWCRRTSTWRRSTRPRRGSTRSSSWSSARTWAHIINACDAGREGELIFRLIVQYAYGDKGTDKPIQRLWLQSMTPQAIRDGFDAAAQRQADAAAWPTPRAAAREADWLVGINGTRAMTAFNSRDGGFFLTTVGRVQTPTLSIVVEREEKIRKHVARDYWEVKASFDAQAGSYDGKWFDPKWKKNDDAEARADRLWNERRRAGHRRRGARPAGHRHRRGQAQHAGQPAAVRPDDAAARGQLALRLHRQDHAVARAGAVREAQGADLPADRLARAARGLPGRGEADLRDDRRARTCRARCANWRRMRARA